MRHFKHLINLCAIVLCFVHLTKPENVVQDIEKIFGKCNKTSPEFDGCIKRAFNKLRPYFKLGMVGYNRLAVTRDPALLKYVVRALRGWLHHPEVLEALQLRVPDDYVGISELGVAPFDPHFAKEVKQTRAINGIRYTLTLKDVYEKGWSQSVVTKYKTDWDNKFIVYSQYFPEKWLNGDYEFKGAVFGVNMVRAGHWNLTLRDYSQTTRVRRSGAGVDVHVEVDHIDGMQIHVSNLLRGNELLERMLGRVINATWKPGFAVIRPLINDLVSTAFTDIWSKSFKNFPIDNFIRD